MLHTSTSYCFYLRRLVPFNTEHRFELLPAARKRLYHSLYCGLLRDLSLLAPPSHPPGGYTGRTRPVRHEKSRRAGQKGGAKSVRAGKWGGGGKGVSRWHRGQKAW